MSTKCINPQQSVTKNFPHDQKIKQYLKQNHPRSESESNDSVTLFRVFDPKHFVTGSEVGTNILGTSPLPESQSPELGSIYVQSSQRIHDTFRINFTKCP